MKEWLNKYFNEGFFGWENFKWLCRELLKVGSSQQGYFSKKRMESGVAFLILQYGMWDILQHLIEKETTSMSDFAIWAGIEAFICGYALNKIEAAKESKPDNVE